MRYSAFCTKECCNPTKPTHWTETPEFQRQWGLAQELWSAGKKDEYFALLREHPDVARYVSSIQDVD